MRTPILNSAHTHVPSGTPEPGNDQNSPPSKAPTRLLIVSSDTFPPTRVDVHVLFGQELAKRGYEVDLILQSDALCERAYSTPWKGGTAWVGKTNHGRSLWSRLRKHIAGIRHDLKLFPLLRSGNYDVIVVKDKFISGIFAAVAARLYKRPLLYWLSYPFPEEYLTRARDGTARYPFLYLIRGTAFKILLYRMLLPAANHIFVQSEQMRRDIAVEGVPTAKMTPIPMGVDVERFSAANIDIGSRRLLPSNELCIIYLGTLVKVRRLDFMVRVLARVKVDLPQTKLYFVGKGDDQDDEELLIREARRLNLSDDVVLVGQLPQAEALRYVQEADVCVSPFFPTPILNSTSPTKLVEYLVMGKAVVANDHPEQRLVIEQSQAGFCVPWDEEAFATALVKLLSDPELARLMGRRGRSYALEFRSYARIADVVAQSLSRLIGEGIQSPGT